MSEATPDKLQPVDFSWCSDRTMAGPIAAFFVEHAATSYISHGELQAGRAKSPVEWQEGLEARIRRQANRAILGQSGRDQPLLLAVAKLGAMFAGFAFLSLSLEAETPYATLEDMIVAPALRGTGLGSAFVDWLTAAARQRGARRVFLESGIRNPKAHDFFERKGFAKVSSVFMIDLA